MLETLHYKVFTRSGVREAAFCRVGYRWEKHFAVFLTTRQHLSKPAKERLIMKIQTLIAVITLVAGGAAFAQAPVTTKDPLATPKIDQRQANQERRIDQGIASGALTTKEATRLDKRETKIESDKLAAKADGKITGAERRKLTREENRASRAIHRQKHDRQTAAPVAAR